MPAPRWHAARAAELARLSATDALAATETLLAIAAAAHADVSPLFAAAPHPRDFALAHRVLLLQGQSRVPLDIALGAMPFEERCVERASAFAIGE